MNVMGFFTKKKENRIRKADDCRDILVYNDAVGFGYFKKEDGSFRIARGTLQPDIIDANYFFVGGYTYDDTKQVRYWDLDNNEWRSFCFINLIRTSFKVLNGDESGWNEIINECKEYSPDFVEKLVVEPTQKHNLGFIWQKKKE